MIDEVVAPAAYNNAVWCDAVCATHSGPGEFAPQHWLTRHGAPEYYPDLVTLTGAADAARQTEALNTLMRNARDRSLSVKDSFNCLDLEALGFARLFDAEWLAATELAAPGSRQADDVAWVVIDNDPDLVRWEQAWRQGAGTGKPRMFRSSLLLSRDIQFIYGLVRGEVVGGAILNSAGGVTGLSNVFASEITTDAVLQGLARVAWNRHPTQPLVSYGRGITLAAAQRVGFATVGQLRVWLSSVNASQ